MNNAGLGWRSSANGHLLSLPSDHEDRDSIASLKRLVVEVLPSLSAAASGDATWIGEDGERGLLRVENGLVEVLEPEAEALASREVARLLAQLKRGTEAEKLEAAEIIDYLEVSPEDFVETLAEGLSDPSLKVRMRMADSLAAFGSASLPALDRLVASLGDHEPWMQAAAAEAIGEIGAGARAAIPALEQLTRHPSYGPSGRAREALAKIRG